MFFFKNAKKSKSLHSFQIVWLVDKKKGDKARERERERENGGKEPLCMANRQILLAFNPRPAVARPLFSPNYYHLPFLYLGLYGYILGKYRTPSSLFFSCSVDIKNSEEKKRDPKKFYTSTRFNLFFLWYIYNFVLMG